jgi:hypothetical protein
MRCIIYRTEKFALTWADWLFVHDSFFFTRCFLLFAYFPPFARVSGHAPAVSRKVLGAHMI